MCISHRILHCLAVCLLHIVVGIIEGIGRARENVEERIEHGRYSANIKGEVMLHASLTLRVDRVTERIRAGVDFVEILNDLLYIIEVLNGVVLKPTFLPAHELDDRLHRREKLRQGMAFEDVWS